MHKILVSLVLATVALSKITWKKEHHQELVSIVNNHPASTWKAKLAEGFDYDNGASLVAKCAGDKLPELSSERAVKHSGRVFGRVLQTLPESYDLRAVYPDCTSIQMIRDQGSCGGCYAISAANSLSDRHCIKSVKAGKLEERFYSAQDIVECCDSQVCQSATGNGCSGGSADGPYSYATNVGVVTGGLYHDYAKCKPWETQSGDTVTSTQCRKQCTNTTAYTTPYADDLRKIANYTVYTLANTDNANMVAAMQNAILNRGSISSYLTVYFDFFTYSGGVYKHLTGELAGGHVVRLVGWGVNEGVKYWIGANCWGAGWGNKGFFWILRGTNEANIETVAAEGLL